METGKTIYKMVSGFTFGWKTREKENYWEIDMRVSGKTDKGMDTEFSTMPMDPNMQENGEIT